MATYICPEHITRLFETDPEKGRAAAVKWVEEVAPIKGDIVWLPEIGWTVKEDAVQ